MKWQGITILLIILLALIPLYSLNKYFQKVIRPRESIGRLFLLLLANMLLILAYTFLIVFVIRVVFPAA